MYSAPYTAGLLARQFTVTKTDRILHKEAIESTATEWADPDVLAPRRDRSHRFCVDYYKLDAVTTRNPYPLPRMDECIESLNDDCIFLTLYTNSEYWHVENDERDRERKLFHRLLWPVPICADAVCCKERPQYLSKGDGRRTALSKVPIDISILGRHRSLLENRL